MTIEKNHGTLWTNVIKKKIIKKIKKENEMGEKPKNENEPKLIKGMACFRTCYNESENSSQIPPMPG